MKLWPSAGSSGVTAGGAASAGRFRPATTVVVALGGLFAVESDREQAAFAENAVRYQASLQFLSNRINSMINVLKGGNN